MIRKATGAFSTWRTRRMVDRIGAQAIEEGRVQGLVPINPAIARRLSGEAIHWRLAKSKDNHELSILNAELRRREGLPARRIALGALAVSVVSIGISVFW